MVKASSKGSDSGSREESMDPKKILKVNYINFIV